MATVSNENWLRLCPTSGRAKSRAQSGDFSEVFRNRIYVHYPTLPLVTARLGSFGSDTLWSLRNTDVRDERIYNLQSVCMFGK
ncbi:hypothetical protein BDFB_005079 [Asbolus verrucosus]|uniref:Uncharacterized protein n=1 Tax=Asbolus verrucosus TaxID=1661398 RepID=A0A482WEN5_ASBVE|nr:hypothetical protein BDFB_005079 [Asbolus verrucosus]